MIRNCLNFEPTAFFRFFSKFDSDGRFKRRIKFYVWNGVLDSLKIKIAKVVAFSAFSDFGSISDRVTFIN